MKKSISAIILVTLAVFSLTINSCKKDNNPVACIQSDNVFIINTPATFTSCATDAETYLWDFGDGQTANNANPSHTYTTGGSYTVTLTVTGKGGTDTKTKTIQVSIPASNFAGNYNSTEACTSGNYSYTMTLTATGANTLSFENFGDFGTADNLIATVNGYDINIANQSYAGGNLHGSGTFGQSLNALTVRYFYTAGGVTDSCTINAVRQ